jgi:hypothetical protein
LENQEHCSEICHVAFCNAARHLRILPWFSDDPLHKHKHILAVLSTRPPIIKQLCKSS